MMEIMTHSDGEAESIVVVGPDGQPLVIPASSRGESALGGQVIGEGDEEAQESMADMVEQPAKVMRIGTMIKQLLEEVRHAPLNHPIRTRLRDIHRTSVRELDQGLAPVLRE